MVELVVVVVAAYVEPIVVAVAAVVKEQGKVMDQLMDDTELVVVVAVEPPKRLEVLQSLAVDEDQLAAVATVVVPNCLDRMVAFVDEAVVAASVEHVVVVAKLPHPHAIVAYLDIVLHASVAAVAVEVVVAVAFVVDVAVVLVVVACNSLVEFDQIHLEFVLRKLSVLA